MTEILLWIWQMLRSWGVHATIQVLPNLPEPMPPVSPAPTAVDPEFPSASAEKIYHCAVALMGTDASPKDMAPDTLACAETVWNIVLTATGVRLGGGSALLSTTLLYQAILKSPSFESVTLDDSMPGDIIISPTGYAANRAAHGHTGIVAKYGILSNNSENGKLEENYTHNSWKSYFGGRGFPVCVFRMNP